MSRRHGVPVASDGPPGSGDRGRADVPGGTLAEENE